MQKVFEVAQRNGAWDVLHNRVGFRRCESKREAIRIALLLGRMQLRLGDEAEVILRDDDGAAQAHRHISAQAPQQA
jgi:hypothetical protein